MVWLAVISGVQAEKKKKEKADKEAKKMMRASSNEQAEDEPDAGQEHECEDIEAPRKKRSRA